MEQDFKNSEIPEQVEYNLSSFKIRWIAELIQQADMWYLKGRIDKSFECWKCVYGQINNRIEDDENKKCKIMEGKFRKNLNKREKVMQSYYYERYAKILQSLLKKYGFDMREKESSEHLV